MCAQWRFELVLECLENRSLLCNFTETLKNHLKAEFWYSENRDMLSVCTREKEVNLSNIHKVQIFTIRIWNFSLVAVWNSELPLVQCYMQPCWSQLHRVLLGSVSWGWLCVLIRTFFRIIWETSYFTAFFSFLVSQINVRHRALLVALCVQFCSSRFKRDLTVKTRSSPGVVFGFFFFFCLDLRWVLFWFLFLKRR